MKVEISFPKKEIKGAKECKAKGESICDAIDCDVMEICEMCPLQMLNDDEAIQYMESHQADDEEEEKEEESEKPATDSSTSDREAFSISGAMIRKMIEAYERRN